MSYVGSVKAGAARIFGVTAGSRHFFTEALYEIIFARQHDPAQFERVDDLFRDAPLPTQDLIECAPIYACLPRPLRLPASTFYFSFQEA
jgi:hypothetical protein